MLGKLDKLDQLRLQIQGSLDARHCKSMVGRYTPGSTNIAGRKMDPELMRFLCDSPIFEPKKSDKAEFLGAKSWRGKIPGSNHRHFALKKRVSKTGNDPASFLGGSKDLF